VLSGRKSWRVQRSAKLILLNCFQLNVLTQLQVEGGNLKIEKVLIICRVEEIVPCDALNIIHQQ